MDDPPVGAMTEGPKSRAASQDDARVATPDAPYDDPRQLDLLAELEAARRGRDAGATRADHAASFAWREAVDRAIAQLANTGGPFTAETVRAALTPGDRGVADAHPNALGARFLAASRAGIIMPHGYTAATRREAHGRALRVWRGAP